MKNYYFYSLVAIICASRIAPKPMCALGMVVFVALAVFADMRGG